LQWRRQEGKRKKGGRERKGQERREGLSPNKNPGYGPVLHC